MKNIVLFIYMMTFGFCAFSWDTARAADVPETLRNGPGAEVWRAFWEISAVPRGSGREAGIRDMLKAEADRLGLPATVDAVGNLLVRVPATRGREKEPVTVCHAHLDMVCDRVPESRHDFERDPIVPGVSGEWVSANGTTLGADNGIGVAALLALMRGAAAEHGRLELLFTVDEEGNFTGVYGLTPTFFEGRRLINLDSETDGELNIGCAGGRADTAVLPWPRKPAGGSDVQALRVTIGSLQGGHSGVDIHRGRANAIRLAGQLLRTVASVVPLRLIAIRGGSIDTTIPRDVLLDLVIPTKHLPFLAEMLPALQKRLRREYGAADPGIELRVVPILGRQPDALSVDETRKFTEFILELPSGIQQMSSQFPGLVETSMNPGVITTATESVTLISHLQSSKPPAIAALGETIARLAARHGGTCEAGVPYPPWQTSPDAPLVKKVCDLYRAVTGSAMKLNVVHAGLECGAIAERVPGMEMVSFGPTIENAHTPRERLNVPSVGRFFGLLTRLLAERF
ncbi:MAG TPA: beta-Ala-His dipeptidase [Candidatus Ozemobacteraceae bacterium]|nr:beta-Ala-His dipeptidase [Candidatus Ozemobacteraceae bacterium]